MKFYKNIVIFFLILFLFSFVFAIPSFENNSNLDPGSSQDVLGSDDINDPLRGGSTNIAEKTEGIANDEINSSEDAKNSTLDFVKTVLNYFLGLLAFIALVYLLYHFFIIVISVGDEEKYQSGVNSIKYAAIALAGIGVSWFIVSLIFYLIETVTGG